jgi:uncharacterized membrane protein YsdA (DUF1294 family)
MYAVCFALILGVLAALGRLSWLVPAYYAALTLAAFIAYALDKAAAVHGKRRVSERTLHLLAFAGGWPGALAAQRLLRHKTRKQPFQTVYRASVVINCAALVCLASMRGFGLLS